MGTMHTSLMSKSSRTTSMLSSTGHPVGGGMLDTAGGVFVGVYCVRSVQTVP